MPTTDVHCAASSMSKKARLRARARNVLLQPHPLGHAPPSTRSLPADPQFRYGQKNVLNGDSAGMVLSRYQTFEASTKPYVPPASSNLIMMMRKGPTVTHRYGSAAHHLLKPITPQALPSDQDVNYTYGVKSKPDTPAGLLMSDVFQREWLAARDRKIAAKEVRDAERRQLHLNNQQAAFEALVSVRKRREALVKKAQGEVNTLFRLKQFENIPAKVDSHLSGRAAAAAPAASVGASTATSTAIQTS